MRIEAAFVGVWLVVVGAAAAPAQVRTIPGESITVKATVEAVEPSSRQLTLKNADGTYEVLTVPPEVRRFEALKPGDVITARYYENVTFRLKPAGEPALDGGSAALTPVAGAKPGATLAAQRALTATITALDPQIPSVTFTGPNGSRYSSRVEDRGALAKVKVGDRVDITWTMAAVVDIEDPQ